MRDENRKPMKYRSITNRPGLRFTHDRATLFIKEVISEHCRINNVE